MVFFCFHTIHLAVFIRFDDILKREFYQICKKGFCPKQGKSLKIMRFLGLVASQGGLFHLPENTFLKKSVAKTVVQKVPSPETRINTGLFGTSKPKGTIPTPPFPVALRLYRKLLCLHGLLRLLSCWIFLQEHRMVSLPNQLS